MRNRRTFIALFCLLIVTTIHTKSQVTIGSGFKPNPNAFLDLKETIDGHSSKGLLLPRVNLLSHSQSSPLSRHVEGMLVYNLNTANILAPFINNGNRWINIALPKDGKSGDFLILNSQSVPVWTSVNIPLAKEETFSMMESKSFTITDGLTFTSRNSSWRQFGETFAIEPKYRRNRLVIAVQTIVTREYRSGYTSGWVSYAGGVQVNGQMKDSRSGRLVYTSYQNKEAFQNEILYFVLEDIPIGQQTVGIVYRSLEGLNNQSFPLYVGTSLSGNTLNNFITRSLISYQYFEDKSSATE